MVIHTNPESSPRDRTSPSGCRARRSVRSEGATDCLDWYQPVRSSALGRVSCAIGSRVLFPAILASLTSLSGCSLWTSTFGADETTVRIEGLGATPVALDGVLPHAAYVASDSDSSIYASDVPIEEILKGGVRDGQFLHAQLLWIPLPGRTPVDETAMNVTLRYVVVSQGRVGVYGGGGFAWPSGKPGEDDLTLSIEGGSLSLLARSDGFTDLLTPAQLSGTLTAKLDPELTRKFRRGVSQVVTDGLGISRWVDARQQALTGDQVIALALPAESSSASNTD
jgi:hypothetical protein